ncbi:hypothetical protein ACTXPS_14605 [Brachybacterium tyrofermentans]|uniref:hypothetical protein n=1 Tax=Brachybacterium tyrofermentans TaxID=47848 RepID=UPI003FCF298D
MAITSRHGAPPSARASRPTPGLHGGVHSDPKQANRHRTTLARRLSLAPLLATAVLMSGCGMAPAAPADDAPTVTAESSATEEAATEEDAATATDEGADVSDTTADDDGSENTVDAVPEPAPEPEPEPEQIDAPSFTGSGSDVVMLDPLGEAVFYAEVTHDGTGNVALWSVDGNGQDIDLLVNEIGNYSGQVAINFSEEPSALRVEADGDWTITFHHLNEAPRWDGSDTYEATGDSLVIVDGVADGLTPVTLTHAGESNFAIWAWGKSSPDLIVNEIGRYDGTTLLPDGSLVLQVDADGPWTISVE